MEADIIISIAIMTTFMFALFQIARIIRTFSIQRTVREALLRGSTLTPELLAGMDEPARRRVSDDDRIGMVLVAIALALIGFGLLMNSQDNLRAMTGIALFPLFVGVALLGRFWLARRSGGGA
jgi:hypothetical protein